MIYCFTPYDKRGLGHAYNSCCAIVPHEDDLICLMDADVMLFPASFGSLLEEAADKFSNFDMITCRATRIYPSSLQQYRSLNIRVERNLTRLRATAQRVSEGPCLVTPLDGSVSGFLMMFRKKLWDQLPFPIVGSKGHHILGVDTQWVANLRAAGKKIGLMHNLLAVHYYRLHSEGDKSHLMT